MIISEDPMKPLVNSYYHGLKVKEKSRERCPLCDRFDRFHVFWTQCRATCCHCRMGWSIKIDPRTEQEKL
jgi:hypothetical protein